MSSLPEKRGIDPQSTILFRDLKKDAKALFPLPDDTMDGIAYKQFYEPKCTICNSPWRERAEHVYLDSGKKVMPVINFFLDFFNARLNHTQVATHMESHCSFRNVSTSGLKSYEEREDEIKIWRFREDALAITALMVELDDVRGMDVAKNNELKLKRAQVVERLVSKILDVKAKRDEAALLQINIFDILSDLHDAMVSTEDQKIIREKTKEIRLRLTQTSDG